MAIETPAGSLGGQPLQSCASTIRRFQELGLDYSTFYRRATSYTCRLGHEHGTAWLLMKAGDIAKIDSAQPQDLLLGIGTKSVTIKKLAIVHSQRLFPMASQDPEGLHLVQAVDVRWFLRRTTINKRYNLRTYCTESDWIDGTLNSGTPWTFAEIAADIWTNFATFGSFFASFASWSASNIYGTVPTNNPENLRFEGVSALEALASLCQQCGFYLRYNPTVGNLLIIKIGYTPDPAPGQDGEMTTGFGGSRTILASNTTRFPTTPPATPRTADDGLVEDTETFIGVASVPETVRVMFPNNGAGCGDIASVNSNSGRGWHYAVDKTATAIHGATLTGSPYNYLDTTVSGTKVVLYSSTYAQYESSTDTTPNNLSTLESVAERIATDYYRTVNSHSHARLVLGGIKNIIPGPTVCETIWREWGDGLKTELARMPIPVGLDKPPHVFAEGGPLQRIHFTIDSYDEAYGAATCTVKYRPCGMSEVIEEIGGKVTVYDVSGCYFNEDAADLVGRWGHAEYMAPDETIDPYQRCLWIVTGLCCPS